MRSAIAHRIRPRALAGCAAAVAALAGTSACSTASSDTSDGSASDKGASGKVIQIVAAENFWGSIAQQLGGIKSTYAGTPVGASESAKRPPTSSVASPRLTPHTGPWRVFIAPGSPGSVAGKMAGPRPVHVC